MIIQGFCRTNLDGYLTEKWPEMFAFPPNIGDRVQAESGRILYVVGITHKMSKPYGYIQDHPEEPVVEIELHTFSSVHK